MKNVELHGFSDSVPVPPGKFGMMTECSLPMPPIAMSPTSREAAGTRTANSSLE